MDKEEVCIALCDDSEEWIQSMNKMIERYFDSLGIGYKLYELHSGEELLEACRNKSVSTIHLLFLDIEMKGISGIEVKEQLSQMTIVKKIVFVTSHEEAMPMAFGMKVIGFFKKPLLYEQMVRQIETARRELQDISVTYESDYNQRVIAQEQILYIKAAGDYTYLYRAYGEESELVTHSMKYWENLLTQGTFVRVHKSFLVNLRYIVKIENNMVVLENDKENIPVGRAYKKRAEEKIRSYILEIIRSRMR